MIELVVNGTQHRLDDAANAMPLLWVLRDQLQLTGSKFGCGGGFCGACTVHLDGMPIRACQFPTAAAVGHRITTIEGLSADGKHPLQQAWVAEDVPQCGYCQSGQLMSAAALLASGQAITDESISAAMSGNICRCGTYGRINKAIKRAATALKEAK